MSPATHPLHISIALPSITQNPISSFNYFLVGGSLKDLLIGYVMNSWQKVDGFAGGSDMWITLYDGGDPYYLVYHCSRPKDYWGDEGSEWTELPCQIWWRFRWAPKRKRAASKAQAKCATSI